MAINRATGRYVMGEEEKVEGEDVGRRTWGEDRYASDSCYGCMSGDAREGG